MMFTFMSAPEFAVLVDLVLNKYNAETKRLLAGEKNPEDNKFTL